MKVQIDTELKIIKVEDSVNFKELLEFLMKILPDGWHEYKLLTNSKIEYIPYYPLRRWYPNWYYDSPVYGLTNTIGTNSAVDWGKTTTDILTLKYSNDIDADLDTKEIYYCNSDKEKEAEVKKQFKEAGWKVLND